MADPEVRVEATPTEDTPADDVAMADDGDEAEAKAGDGEEVSTLPQAEAPKRATFLDYLKSPMVELVLGTGSDQAVLTAHQAMLVKSPYFADVCAQFSEGSKRRIELPDEDLNATGSFLEYLYMDEYFPRRLNSHKDSPLEPDDSVPTPDDSGAALLKHAKVYTIAEKFGMPALKSLAHSKIHRATSTAKGEIAYARYVYDKTSASDETIRKPVAAFWATRSHVLRHEAEAEFRAMCLEYPQFGFDVLSLVLDMKEKRGERHEGSSQQPPASGRKRARVSQG
ncbi:hypothetical protein W97_05303 [Coniosporium apollinis CBS 100218]|uniref:BTB domain-containing protein n=1 Tax=Coniosporium apollinis (strain CBS 100218) TaxID=1168221 RepID=R7YVW7_CONA1|nr:uncharacterized protein W97_05303 [Coniosporium apollinis CBS 100218]EON66060.1 hypothetical protein W97_05303 [Coniosporium apollinis CBS 100218]